MKKNKLFKKVTAKDVIIFSIILIVVIAVVFIAFNWNIFTESVEVGWNSR